MHRSQCLARVVTQHTRLLLFNCCACNLVWSPNVCRALAVGCRENGWRDLHASCTLQCWHPPPPSPNLEPMHRHDLQHGVENRQVHLQRDTFKGPSGARLWLFPRLSRGVQYSFLKESLTLSPRAGKIPWLDPGQKESHLRGVSVHRKTRSSAAT